MALVLRRAPLGLLFALLGSLPAAFPAAARADEGWLVERLAIHYEIRADGSMAAVEVIDADFGSVERHGIFRDIPFRFAWDGTRDREYDIRLDGVTSVGGKRLRVESTTADGTRRFRIGDPKVTVSGRQEYRIGYRVNGALNPFPDHDELYWNATGVWPVAIRLATVVVDAPGGINRVACFQGPSGSTQPCRSRFTPTEAVFSATRPLASGEQLTIVAGLEKGAVADPQPILVARPRTLTQFFDRSPFFLSVMVLGFAAAVGGIGSLWWRIGRDRRYISLHYLSGDSAEERVPLVGSDPIVVEFEPPDHVRPAEIGLLFDERADTLDVTATIIDLAVRGYLTITELPGKGWFGKTDWRLERAKEADAELLDYEREVLAGLFGDRTACTLSDLKNHFYKALARAKRALYADGVARGWFPRNPETVRTIWTVAGIAASGAGVALVILLGRRWGAGLLGAPVVAAGLLLLMVARAMPRRTADGRELMRRVLGFARYLRTAEQQQQAFAERANIFTSYLPYAIVLKCVDKWARAFKDIDLQRATAGWYVGSSRGFDPVGFSSGLSGFSSSVSSAIASTPGGSGSSGFGGSSGGGGGGGGGGSW